MDLIDAANLFIAEETAVVAQEQPVQKKFSRKEGAPKKKLFKVKPDGKTEEVKYKDDKQNEVDIVLEPSQIVKLNDQYIILAYGQLNSDNAYEKSYLVNINTGSVYLFNFPLPKNVQLDGKGNIYYLTGSDDNNQIKRLSLSDPENIAIKRVSFETDTRIRGWAVDKNGNVWYRAEDPKNPNDHTYDKIRFLLHSSGKNKKMSFIRKILTFVYNETTGIYDGKWSEEKVSVDGTHLYDMYSGTQGNNTIQGADGKIYIGFNYMFDSSPGHEVSIHRLPLVEDNSETQDPNYEIQGERIKDGDGSYAGRCLIYSDVSIDPNKVIRKPTYIAWGYYGRIIKISADGPISCSSAGGSASFQSNNFFYNYGYDGYDLLLTRISPEDFSVVKKTFNIGEGYENLYMSVDDNDKYIYFNAVDSYNGDRVFGTFSLETGETKILAKPTNNESITLVKIK